MGAGIRRAEEAGGAKAPRWRSSPRAQIVGSRCCVLRECSLGRRGRVVAAGPAPAPREHGGAGCTFPPAESPAVPRGGRRRPLRLQRCLKQALQAC